MVRIVKYTENTRRIYYIFVGFELWEDFDTLANILLTQMDAKPLDQINGVYSRCSTFEIGNISFNLLYHEDIGNCLYSIHDSEAEINYLENLAHRMLPYVLNP